MPIGVTCPQCKKVATLRAYDYGFEYRQVECKACSYVVPAEVIALALEAHRKGGSDG